MQVSSRLDRSILTLATSSNLKVLVKMDRQTFTWNHATSRIRRTERWVERFWVLGLFLAGGLLFGLNLGGLPLSNWGEETVALVAREFGKTTIESWQWFYPNLAGEPYFEEPPLLHWLVAAVYGLGGVNEWTTRLPSAILSALSVPLLYGIGREIFPSRQSAIFSSLVYLTLFPVACYGRMALTDSTVMCFVVFLMWCVLRSRRDLRWALGTGLGFGLICLTKGIVSGCLLLAIAVLYLAWDTPRLLTSGYWWLGLLLGSAPSVAWYIAQYLEYGQRFIAIGLIEQSLRRLWTPIALHNNPPWYYLGEIIKFSAPWLLFFPYGLRLAWENRNWGWAKLILVWSSVYFLAISLMFPKLPWSVLPLYPALALAVGAQLTEVWHWPSRHKSFPRFWSLGLLLLALGGIGGSVYFGILTGVDHSLPVILAAVALTMIMAAVLVAKRDLQFILILLWGMYVSLLLFMTSPYWIRQLETTEPVEPIATIFHQKTSEGQMIDASFLQTRSHGDT